MPEGNQAAPWCPDEYPTTGCKFFMRIEPPDDGMLQTYTGDQN
jgi:hypothetical protein